MSYSKDPYTDDMWCDLCGDKPKSVKVDETPSGREIVACGECAWMYSNPLPSISKSKSVKEINYNDR